VILTGLLTRSEGTPLASQQLSVKFTYEHGFTSRNLRTGTDGRLRVNLSSYPRDREGTVGFTTDAMTNQDGLAVELRPRRLQAGINDLGEVRLVPFVVLVAGRLRCDEGVSVRQVQLEIERKQDGRWTQEYNLYPRWLPDGSFSVRCGTPAGLPM